MTLKIIHKNSTSAGTPPAAGDVDIGEIAINAADAKLYIKDAGGAVQEFISKFKQSGSGAVARSIESKLGDVVSIKDFGAIGDGITNDTTAIQFAIDAVAAAGGGTILVPKGTYRLVSILDTSRSSLPPGYVPNNEQRRANKALIIYNAENIRIVGEAGAVFDRSADDAIDTEYAQYSSSLYISKSTNIRVQGLSFKGYQVDIDLLNDIKSSTSGSHIDINSGSSRVIVDGCDFLDGTNGVSVAINRTSAAQSIDPALSPCTDIVIANCDIKNNEHGILLADCRRIYVTNCSIRRFPRGGEDGAIQRGIFIHSASDVSVCNVTISGLFKTGVNISNYKAIRNILFENVNIVDCYPEATVFAKRGSYYNTSFESIGIRIANQDVLLQRTGIVFNNFAIIGFASGVLIDPHGLISQVVLSNGTIQSTRSGIATIDYRDAPNSSDSCINGFSLANLNIQVIEDTVNFPSALPANGLYLQPLTTQNGKNVIISSCSVRARTRNARVYNCESIITGSVFEQLTGYVGARNYDILCAQSRVSLASNLYLTQGAANKGDDVPDNADMLDISDNSNSIALFGSVSTFTSNGADYTQFLRVANGANTQGGYGSSLGFAKPGSIYSCGAAIAIKQSTADIDQCGISFFTGASSNSNSNLRESMELSYDGELTVYKGIVQSPEQSITPSNNGQLVFEATSNTQLTLKYKGSDGVIRSSLITLA